MAPRYQHKPAAAHECAQVTALPLQKLMVIILVVNLALSLAHLACLLSPAHTFSQSQSIASRIHQQLLNIEKSTWEQVKLRAFV